jgi:hypothetical protein
MALTIQIINVTPIPNHYPERKMGSASKGINGVIALPARGDVDQPTRGQGS